MEKIFCNSLHFFKKNIETRSLRLLRVGPFASESLVNASHTWHEKGNFTIKVKAKDIIGAESDWATLEVTMPKNQQLHNWWFLQFLQNHPRMFPTLRHLFRLE